MSKLLEEIRRERAEAVKSLESHDWTSEHRRYLREKVEKLSAWEIEVLEWEAR